MSSAAASAANQANDEDKDKKAGTRYVQSKDALISLVISAKTLIFTLFQQKGFSKRAVLMER
jgi:hypothetical protein